MIRKFEKKDLKQIDIIGSQIKENFLKNYDIDKIKDYDWLNLLVYESNDEVLGFVEFALISENIDIYTIAVLENEKNKGIGTQLIEYLKNNYVYESITLEVRSKNKKAINFYHKNGFEIINIRKNYYEDDDGLLMQYKANSKGSN